MRNSGARGDDWGLPNKEEQRRFEHGDDLPRPLWMKLDEGTYRYCLCGKTSTPPFCDDSHAGTDVTPLEFTSDGNKKVPLCTCGLTKNPPQCRGNHRSECKTAGKQDRDVP